MVRRVIEAVRRLVSPSPSSTLTSAEERARIERWKTEQKRRIQALDARIQAEVAHRDS